LTVIFAISFVGSCEYDDKFIIEEKSLTVVQKGDCYDILQMDGTQQKVVATVCNGKDGQNGQDGRPGADGKTVMVNYNIVESSECSSGYSLVFTSSLEGTPISTASICVPADGKPGQPGQTGASGLTPSLKTTETPLGVVYLWYLDINSNKVYDEGDTKISENLITYGKDGDIASALVCLTLEYDFETSSINYPSRTGFILDKFILSESEGALYLPESCGFVKFPPFSDNMDLLSLRFNYGSKGAWDFVVKAVYKDNSEEVIGTVHLSGNPDFCKYCYYTYSQFEYYADLENIQFKDIKIVKIKAKKDPAKCAPEDLFIDQVVICLRDRNVH
jgi:hypothetical protein